MRGGGVVPSIQGGGSFGRGGDDYNSPPYSPPRNGNNNTNNSHTAMNGSMKPSPQSRDNSSSRGRSSNRAKPY